MRKRRYILRNISKYDINLSDLKYRIPVGQARDLLSRTARLDPKKIQKSIESGSIQKRLGISLIEVWDIKQPRPPRKTLAVPEKAIQLPQRTKSMITIDASEIADEYENSHILQDEDSLLQELIEEDMMENKHSPISYKDKE